MASTCCCCLKLKTGGYIIAGLQLIADICVIILFCAVAIMESIRARPCQKCQCCPPLNGFLIGACIAGILLCIWLVTIALRCIKGIDNRDHCKVKPMKIMFAVATGLSALQFIFLIIKLNPLIIVQGLVSFVVNGYQYLIIYELYEEFKNEFESRWNNSSKLHYQAHGKIEFIA